MNILFNILIKLSFLFLLLIIHALVTISLSCILDQASSFCLIHIDLICFNIVHGFQKCLLQPLVFLFIHVFQVNATKLLHLLDKSLLFFKLVPINLYDLLLQIVLLLWLRVVQLLQHLLQHLLILLLFLLVRFLLYRCSVQLFIGCLSCSEKFVWIDCCDIVSEVCILKLHISIKTKWVLYCRRNLSHEFRDKVIFRFINHVEQISHCFLQPESSLVIVKQNL